MYSWMRLIWMSNSADGSSLIPRRSATRLESRCLVGALHRGEFLAEGGILGQRIETRQQVDVVEEAVADRFARQIGEAGIALDQPAARRDAVGLVVDAVRIKPVKVGKYRLLHQVRVQRRHAIDRCASRRRPDCPCARGGRRPFVDQRNAADLLARRIFPSRAPRAGSCALIA